MMNSNAFIFAFTYLALLKYISFLPFELVLAMVLMYLPVNPDNFPQNRHVFQDDWVHGRVFRL